MQNMKQYGNFTYGFVTGGLIIGGLALLFAPKKGSKLRKDIYKAKDELMNTAGDYLNSAKNATDDLIKEGKHKINDLMNSSEAKDLIDTSGKYLNNTMDKAEDLITKSKEKIGKMMDSDDKHKTSHKKHSNH